MSATGGRAGTGTGGKGVGTGGSGTAGSGGTSIGSGGSGGVPAPIDGGDAGIADAGDGAVAPTRGPTPGRGGHNFPFPQNRQSTNCVYPSAYRNEDVQAAYLQWKADTVTSDGTTDAGGVKHLRVKRLPSDPTLDAGSTVSEGIGYGMLAAVYMDDQPLFDELWKYEQMWLDLNGLMDWYINAAGTMRLGIGAATDADEDMAYALLMADKQWGGQGTLAKTYLQNAKDQIAKIWNHEVVDSKLIAPGDTWGTWDTINISYFAPSYYRLFEKIDGNTAGWDAVIKTVYDTIAVSLNATNKNQTNGLVPAWCTSTGAPNGSAFGGMSGPSPTNYQYDSCRTPFRVGLDWCQTGEVRARDYVAKTSAFFGGLPFASIVDGYNLDGTPQPVNPAHTASGQSAAFMGPAGVGAMSAASFQPFLEKAYTAVATRTLLAGGGYYDGSWTVLSLLMMTANFLDYTIY